MLYILLLFLFLIYIIVLKHKHRNLQLSSNTRGDDPRLGFAGIGKTTVVRKAVEEMRRRVKVRGFYTAEVRDSNEDGERGQRVGFDVVLLPEGQVSTPLARVCNGEQENGENNGSSGGREARMGRYSVMVESFESHALPEIKVRRRLAGKNKT